MLDKEIKKLSNNIIYHVFEATQHRRRNDAQEQSYNVEDGGRPEQAVQMHHVLAALHLCVLMVAPIELHAAAPVGETESTSVSAQASER